MLIHFNRNNLQKLINQYQLDFQYLKPQSKVFYNRHTQNQFFYWKDNQHKVKGRRRIYYEVQYQPEQVNAISEVQNRLFSSQINLALSKQIILKYLHAQNLNIENTLTSIKQLQKMYISRITNLSAQTIINLKRGFIYSLGYSKDYRPLIIIRVDLFSKLGLEFESIFNTFYYLLLVVMQYKMHPYYSQKFILIIDLNNMNLAEMPYTHIYNMLGKLALFSCALTDHSFVLNANGIWALWACVKKILPESSIKKVSFIYQDKTQLYDIVDKSQLEQRYGGIIRNIEQNQYWPPKSTPKCGPGHRLNRQQTQKHQDTDFYSVCNEQNRFQPGYIDLSSEVVSSNGGCCNSECRIF